MESTTIQTLHVLVAIFTVSAFCTIASIGEKRAKFVLTGFIVSVLVAGSICLYEKPDANVIKKGEISNVTMYYDYSPAEYNTPTQLDFTYNNENYGVYVKGNRMNIDGYKSIKYKILEGQSNEIQFKYSGVRNKLLHVSPEVEVVIIYDTVTVKDILIKGEIK